MGTHQSKSVHSQNPQQIIQHNPNVSDCNLPDQTKKSFQKQEKVEEINNGEQKKQKIKSQPIQKNINKASTHQSPIDCKASEEKISKFQHLCFTSMKIWLPIVIILILCLIAGIIYLSIRINEEDKISFIDKIITKYDDGSFMSVIYLAYKQTTPTGESYLPLTVTVADSNSTVDEMIAKERNLQTQDNLIAKKSSKSMRIHHNFQKAGLTISMDSLGRTFFSLQQNVFIDYYLKSNPEFQQNSNVTENNTSSQNVSQQQFIDTLNAVFTLEIQKYSQGQVKFQKAKMVTFKINPQTSMYEFDQTVKKRLLMMDGPTRKLFIGGIAKFLGNVVSKVAGFVIDAVRKNGPLIGKIVGGVVGGIAGIPGGPMGIFQGAMQGMQFGEMIGTAAQSLVSACIPSGTIRISCSLNSVTSILTQFAGNAFSTVTGTLIPGIGQMTGGSMSSLFQNLGVGQISKMIPGGAIQNFAMGGISNFGNNFSFFKL